MTISAIVNPLFQPAMRIISNITNANPALITTTFAHNYKTLLIVRIDMPPDFGMQQINQLTGTIVVTSPTTFTIDINTTKFDVFSTPVNWPYSQQLAQVVPFSEDNSTLKSATVNNSNPS